MKNKKEILIILAILTCAFILRLAYMIFLSQNYFFYDFPSDDVLYYQQWAQNIAGGKWLGAEVFYGMPLFPYFLAVLYRLTFANLFLIRLIHLLLGSMSCVLIYLIAKKIFSTKTAYLAAALAVTNFILIYYDWLMMPVTLIIFLSLAIILALLSLDLNSKKSDWGILGVLIGLGILSDGKFLIFFALLFGYLLTLYRQKIQHAAFKIFFPLLFGVVLVLSLVTLRNRLVSNDWVMVSAHGGINFYIGNNPQADGTFENPAFLHPDHEGHIEGPRIMAEESLKRKLKPSEVSDFWSKKGWDFIKNSPKKYADLFFRKFYLFFVENEFCHDIDLILQQKWKQALDVNSFRVICPLAILGILATIRRNRQTSLLVFFIASQLIFTLMFFLITRHRATVLPFFIIFEAVGISWVIVEIRKRDITKLALATLAFFLLFAMLRPEPVNPDLRNFLYFSKSGPIYAQWGDMKKAREQYLSALKLQPFDTNTLYNLGNTYIEEGNAPEAIKIFTKVLRLNPLDSDALFNLAYADDQNGNTAAAKEMYTKVLELQPQSNDAHFQLGNIFRLEGRCQEAAKHYTQVIQNAPKLSDVIIPLISNCPPKTQ